MLPAVPERRWIGRLKSTLRRLPPIHSTRFVPSPECHILRVTGVRHPDGVRDGQRSGNDVPAGWKADYPLRGEGGVEHILDGCRVVSRPVALGPVSFDVVTWVLG